MEMGGGVCLLSVCLVMWQWAGLKCAPKKKRNVQKKLNVEIIKCKPSPLVAKGEGRAWLEQWGSGGFSLRGVGCSCIGCRQTRVFG